MLAACDVCGVEYVEYEGACQEWAPSATDKQILKGNPPMCPGTVSMEATLRRVLNSRTQLVRRAAPFVNAAAYIAEDKTPSLAWLADAGAACGNLPKTPGGRAS